MNTHGYNGEWAIKTLRVFGLTEKRGGYFYKGLPIGLQGIFDAVHDLVQRGLILIPAEPKRETPKDVAPTPRKEPQVKQEARQPREAVKRGCKTYKGDCAALSARMLRLKAHLGDIGPIEMAEYIGRTSHGTITKVYKQTPLRIKLAEYILTRLDEIEAELGIKG